MNVSRLSLGLRHNVRFGDYMVFFEGAEWEALMTKAA